MHYVETRNTHARQCSNLPLFDGGGAQRESVADGVEEGLLARRHEVVEQRVLFVQHREADNYYNTVVYINQCSLIYIINVRRYLYARTGT